MTCRTSCSGSHRIGILRIRNHGAGRNPKMGALHHATVSHNDIVGYYFASITLLYGITLGLLPIGVWSTFTETEAKVDREASTLAALYLDVSHYPEPSRGHLQDDLRR